MPSNRYTLTLQKCGLFVLLLTSLTITFSACSKQDSTTPTLTSITDLINNGSKFTLLKAALVRAGLDGTLSQPGTYTVFAPTDDAFKAFGYVDVAAVNAAPVDLLKSVLQYHVLGTRIGIDGCATGREHHTKHVVAYRSGLHLESGVGTPLQPPPNYPSTERV